MKEVWKNVVDWEGLYQVSNLGRVKSLKRIVDGKNNTPRVLPEKIIRQSPITKHTLRVKFTMTYQGVSKTLYTHRAVLEAFKGICPKGFEGSHIDGNPNNNSLDNLIWESHKDNIGRQIEHGTRNFGETNGSSKLKGHDVINIRKLHKSSDYSYADIGRIYNTTGTNISLIVRRKRWDHIKQ